MLPRAEWDATDPSRDYAPESLERDGFIHCTDDLQRLAWVGNQFYRSIPGDFVALVLDRRRLSAPVRYDDPQRFFPHVYGPIDRGAILRVIRVPRDEQGAFLPLDDRDREQDAFGPSRED